MSNLDQLVKGAPPPGKEFTIPSTSPIIAADSTNPSLPDPLASLPSSPPQIYLNLLILEASLRAQYLQLRGRRRQHTFFLTLLSAWILGFSYALFLAPREDGSGLGGSVYYMIEAFEKLALGSGFVCVVLVYFSGMWERGIRWPRRWYTHANKGLRGFSCKLVIIKQPRWKEAFSMLSFVFSYGLFSSNSGSSYRFVDQSLLVESEKATRTGAHHALPNIHEDDYTEGYEEDLAPGGDYIKLLLLPKPFSPNFRENWEIYRTEYWEKENERRAVLRKKIKERDRKIAKEQGGWLWWTGYRGWNRGRTPDVERTHHNVHRAGTHGSQRVRSGSVRNGSHSRNSSRSVTPTAEVEDGATGGHVRRSSTASNASDRRRKKTGSMRVQKLTPAGSRSATPDVPSPLVRENSFTSVSSLDTERSPTPAGEGDSVRSTKRSSVKTGGGGSPERKPGSARASKQSTSAEAEE
jgi:hypothetical protein